MNNKNESQDDQTKMYFEYKFYYLLLNSYIKNIKKKFFLI